MGRLSKWETRFFLIAELTLALHSSFCGCPLQKKVYPALSSISWPSWANCISLYAAVSFRPSINQSRLPSRRVSLIWTIKECVDIPCCNNETKRKVWGLFKVQLHDGTSSRHGKLVTAVWHEQFLGHCFLALSSDCSWLCGPCIEQLSRSRYCWTTVSPEVSTEGPMSWPALV